MNQADQQKPPQPPRKPRAKNQRKDDQQVRELKSTLPKYMADKGIEAYPSMPVQFGRLTAKVFGGKFEEWTPGQRRVVSVKMAAEISREHDISIPTHDFSTPDINDMHKGIAKALEAIYNGSDLYVGCKGGIGRTGLFMACLAKVMFDYDFLQKAGEVKYRDPVRYVREHYFEHAVETEEQKQFVNSFNTREHTRWLKSVLDPQVVRVPEVVVKTVEVPVYHFNPFLAIAQFFGRGGVKGPHES
jgi:hypothetical protein